MRTQMGGTIITTWLTDILVPEYLREIPENKITESAVVRGRCGNATNDNTGWWAYCGLVDYRVRFGQVRPDQTSNWDWCTE